MNDPERVISKALVLAAGNGSRLLCDVPKPLFPLLGLPLLARTLFTLERAGISDAYVVLGYEADRIRREMEKIGRLKIRVHWLYNDRWDQPNGLSVLQAESAIDEPFILAMADHVFDPSVISALQDQGCSIDGVNLAVDYDVDSVFDLEEATKVQVANGRILSIGKSLRSYDAIDTGVFLATPALFEAIKKACARGRKTLSDGILELADSGLATVTDIGERNWHDIDTLADAKAAERKLIANVRKPTDGPISRYINRPISISLSKLLVRTGITPNQVSVLGLVVGLGSACLAAVGGYVHLLLSGLLFQLASVLDGTDGEVAKFTFRTSVRGEWIDTICDQISYFAFVVGLIIGVHRSGLPDFYFLWGVVGLVSASASMVAISVYLIRAKTSGSALSVPYGFKRGTGLVSRVLRVLQFFGKRDMFAFLAMLLALLGQLPLALPIVGIGATFILLPATIAVNLSPFRKTSADRRQTKRTPTTTDDGEQAAERKSDPAAVLVQT
jgi:CDP-L-myo-inositol myo-inositolphosphotransferase